ncbi:hypothetical protein, partial [Ochrobactrum chromiisoli]
VIRAFFKMQWEAIFCHRPDYGRLQVSAQLHSEIAPPTDMPRLPAMTCGDENSTQNHQHETIGFIQLFES